MHTHTHEEREEEALVVPHTSGIGNTQWTFVTGVSRRRPHGCFFPTSDRSERLAVTRIIPSSQEARPPHTLHLPERVCVWCD